MERLRDHMEAAIRERWQESPDVEPAAQRVPPTGVPPTGVPPTGVPPTGVPPTGVPPTGVPPDPQRPVGIAEPPVPVRSPAIRTVPVNSEALARNRIVAAHAESSQRDVYLDLQAAVLRSVDEEGLRVIGVTSPTGGSGTTLTSVNLTVSLAVNAHRPVMIIDFNFDAPEVHGLFDVDLTAGLEDHLFNDTPIADVLLSPSIEGVLVLPARGSVGTATEAIRRPQLAELLEVLKRDYPEAILVLDLPSLNGTSAGQAFDALADGILLVVEDDVTEERDYRRALQSLSGRKLIGTVLNRAPSI